LSRLKKNLLDFPYGDRSLRGNSRKGTKKDKEDGFRAKISRVIRLEKEKSEGEDLRAFL
jgi:hypothetical protein